MEASQAARAPAACSILSARPGSSCRAGMSGHCAGRGCCARSGQPDRPVVSIVAPPGYGKSSLLVQWATEGSAPVAWLTADDSDNDPVVFLTDLATAVDRRVPLGAEVFSAIAADTVSHRTDARAIVGSDVPTLGAGPDRHRRRAPDHFKGESRHPCRAGRAPARRVPGGRGWTRTDTPPVRPLARRGFNARVRSCRAGDGRA